MSSALLLALQVAATVQSGNATLTGLIRDAESGRPLVGATVMLVDVHRSTRTDASGLYSFRAVPAGPQHIEVRFMGHAQRTLHALVPHEGRLEIHVSLVAVATRLRPVEVRPTVLLAGVDEQLPDAGHARSLSLTAVRNNPQMLEPDVFLALGGAWVRAQPESPNGMHIRGGASDQTAYTLDAIPVFSPYHTSGVFSAWNPDAIARVDLSAAAPRVTDPHALSGTISARTRTPGERVQTQATVSTSHARATVDGPIGVGPAGFLFSARAGYPTIVGRRDDESYTRGRTRDWLGKIEAPVRHGRVRLLGYLNENELNTGVAAEAVPGDRSQRNLFEWNSASIGAAWERDGDSKNLRALAWSSRSTANSAWFAIDAALGMAASWRDEGVSFTSDQRMFGGTTTLGGRAEHLYSRYGVDSLAGNARNWHLRGSSWLGTVFSEHQRSLGHWHLRLGAAAFATSDVLRASPRAHLQWQASDALAISASYARLHQPAQSLRNAESVAGNIFPVDLLVGAGTPNVPVASVDQSELRAEYRHASGARVAAQAFTRAMHGLVLVAPVEIEPFATRPFAVGSGTATGVSFEAAKSAQRWGVSASYGLQNVEYTLGNACFTPSHGTRHMAEAGIIVFPSATSSLRLGVAGEDGRRTTLFSDGFEWEACNLRDRGCEFGGSPRADGGPLGGTPLPRYVRVDVGVQKHWHLRAAGRDALVAVFAAMTNVAGRLNVLTYSRDPVNGARSPIEMRPQAPLVVGLDWRF